MSRTKIQWTEFSWNPVCGCTKVSPGCDNCYAERMAYRLACMGQEKYKGVTTCYDSHNGWNGLVHCDEKALEIPLHWRKPRMIFVPSMGDLFHKDVPFEFIAKVMWVAAKHVGRTKKKSIFQFLTKRPERLLEFSQWASPKANTPFPDNFWFGVTIEHPDYKYRADILRQTPAAVRFLSIEPCLEDMGELNLDGIHWVIVGGESGPRARPMHPDCARGVRDQCVAAGVPFFFKQWGEWLPGEQQPAMGIFNSDATKWKSQKDGKWYKHKIINGRGFIRVGKKKAGRLLDGREWNEYPKSAAGGKGE